MNLMYNLQEQQNNWNLLSIQEVAYLAFARKQKNEGDMKLTRADESRSTNFFK